MGASDQHLVRSLTTHARIQVLELMQLCRAYISTLVNGSELAHPVTLGALQASSGHSLCGSLSSLWQVQADR